MALKRKKKKKKERQRKKRKKKRKTQVYNGYWAITSTYRPFFFPFPAGPLRTVGAPSKSSIELALLKEVEGLGGGANPPELPGGVGAAAPVDTDRGNGGGAPNPDGGAGLPDIGGGANAPADDDGRLAALAIGGVAVGGRLAVLPVLLAGPALGGGGVAAEGVAELGSFLLTHFLSSVS